MSPDKRQGTGLLIYGLPARSENAPLRRPGGCISGLGVCAGRACVPRGRRRRDPPADRNHLSGVRRQGPKNADGDTWQGMARLHAWLRSRDPRASLHPEQMMRRMSDSRGLGDDERKSLFAASTRDHRAVRLLRHPAVDPRSLAALYGGRGQTHAAGLSEDRIPGLRRHRHSLYGLRNGPHRRRQAAHRARRRHRSVRPPGGRPLGQYRLAARRPKPLRVRVRDCGQAPDMPIIAGDRGVRSTPAGGKRYRWAGRYACF